jgi:hypothetical protein
VHSLRGKRTPREGAGQLPAFLLEIGASYPTNYLPACRTTPAEQQAAVLLGKGDAFMSLVKRHPLVTFFVLTYAIAWGFWPVGSFGAFAPLIAVLIMIPLSQGVAGLKQLGLRMIRWRVRWYWYVVAIALPIAVVAVSAVLNVALGASAPSLASYGSFTTVLMVFAIRLVNPLDGPLGEEPGWRGFALLGCKGPVSRRLCPP